MTNRVSSSWTLFLKLLFPLFWALFFGAITAIVLINENIIIDGLTADQTNIAFIGFYITGIFILFWAFLRLKRVELEENEIYITNYFKTYKIPFENIKLIKVSNRGPFEMIHIYFKRKTSFGSKIFFISTKTRLNIYLFNNDSLKDLIK